MKQAHAQVYTDSVLKILDGATGLVDLAPELGIPRTLGLSNEEWLQRRIMGPVKLTRDERRKVAAQLTAPVANGGDGMSNRQAAKAL
ncbi:MAG: hypothetical protein ACRDLV_16905, partial [Solirubrobacteraceae bacterium]